MSVPVVSLLHIRQLSTAYSHHLSAGGCCLTKTCRCAGTRGCRSLCPVHIPIFMLSCGSLADIQDDQVVEAVSRDKKRELPLEQILALTEETFHSALLETARTVVMFYASCEYEMWPGSPFSKLALLTMLSVIW